MSLCIAGRAAFGASLMLFIVGAAGAVADVPATQSTAAAVWLTAGDRPPYPNQMPLLSWEIYRQAMLIAARDGLGLATRDGSLREWKTTESPSEALALSIEGRGISFSKVAGEQKDVIWRGAVPGIDWPNNFAALTVVAERLSREDFVSALHEHGWSGTGNVIRADAAEPAEVEGLLGQMDELSQFTALRLTHTAIAADGESAPRLGALVRAYANLSQLAQLQLSAESDVYEARALLYAQRMVAADSNSAFALWHRAYALAMGGLGRAAVSDLKNAAARATGETPNWVALLEPLCRYQPKKLSDLAAADASIASLGTYMAFLTLENSGSQAATMIAAQAALAANPNCLRLVDAMCDETGPGMLNELTVQGPAMLSQMLGNRLTKMPRLPPELIVFMQKVRRPGGNPTGRETVCQALIDAGEVGKDSGEPSWALLGRLIQEITFSQVQRRADLIADQWGVDASDFAQEVRPIIADHPYKGFIEAYGLVHGTDSQALQVAANDFSGDQMTTSAMRLSMLETNVNWMGLKGGDRVFNSVYRNLDCTSNALSRMFKAYVGSSSADSTWLRTLLDYASPDSPALLVERIEDHWRADQAVKWESEHGDYPSVAFALGEKYADLKQWSDAERCLKKAIALSPDYRGYEALASLYKTQNQDAQWVATLNEFLQQPEYGLEHEMVQVQIANYYMAGGDYDKALPLADAAAATGAGAGLLCAAGAHAGIGKWDEAEQLIVEEMTHYSQSPFRWYAWCLRLGHGNRLAATKALQDYFTAKQDRLTEDDMLQFACLDIIEHHDDQAIAMFQKRDDRYRGPLSSLHVAMIADGMHDAQTRDSALARIPTEPNTPAPILQFAAALSDAAKKGPDAEPDETAISQAAKNAEPVDRIMILYLAGRWHQIRGDRDGAIAYFRGCIFGFTGYSPDLLLAEDALRQLGVDPLDLERAAAGPGQHISLEP